MRNENKTKKDLKGGFWIMTKKSLAALMLAGAMMTVGSGAMAADINSGDAITGSGTASVPVTYSATDSVNIVLNWNNLNDIKYEWSSGESGGQWKLATSDSNGDQTITFSAQNKGFASQNVKVEAPTIPVDMTWLTGELAKIADEATASNNKDLTGNATTAENVAAYKITAASTVDKDTLSIGNVTSAGNITFTVTVASVNP